MHLDDLKKQFKDLYGEGKNEIFYFFAPGRVNLIGEHTDYNKGYVLPAALSFGTYLLARKTGAGSIKLSTTNFDYEAEIPLDELGRKHGAEWVNYPLGVINEFDKKRMGIGGMELLYSGNIPAAAGLSSSASIELVTAVAVNELYAHGLDALELVHMGVRAEREFVGVQCGIMDQFIVGKGKKEAALFLNCGSEQFTHVPFKPEGYRLVIADTKKVRKLSDSKYNERVAECNAGLTAVKGRLHVNSLSEISVESLPDIGKMITDKTVWKRVRHVITENRRVLEAVKALHNKDYDHFGVLMNLSHDSLRNDYEVTGFELDSMVEVSRQQQGVLGSRMTGAGFGGCTVSLVREDEVGEFTENVKKAYREKTGLIAEFYMPEIVGGARRLMRS